MAWNTSAAKYRSAELAALDCAPNTRQARTSETRLWGNFTASATQVLGVGECVAMVRIPTGAVILGGDLYWDFAVNTTLGVGDPFACGRLVGPVSTILRRGRHSTSADSCALWDAPWGECGRIERMGTQGDGCGIGYTYTCETDIMVTNLYSALYAQVGGWPSGGHAGGAHPGAAITAGKFTLVIDIKPV